MPTTKEERQRPKQRRTRRGRGIFVFPKRKHDHDEAAAAQCWPSSSCLCWKPPPPSAPPPAASSSSPARCDDPNDPAGFTMVMLRGLIETNDFYSKESNPHLHPHIILNS